MSLFSRHSIDIERLVRRLETSTRTLNLHKEMAIVWPGSRDIASKPDVIAERLNPHDPSTRYFDAYDVKTSARTGGYSSQAARYFKIIDLYNERDGLGLIPRYVHVNFRVGQFYRVRRCDL